MDAAEMELKRTGNRAGKEILEARIENRRQTAVSPATIP